MELKKENYQNMLKLPEVSDRKKGRRMRKEKGNSQLKGEAHNHSAVNGKATSKSPNCKGKPTWSL